MDSTCVRLVVLLTQESTRANANEGGQKLCPGSILSSLMLPIHLEISTGVPLTSSLSNTYAFASTICRTIPHPIAEEIDGCQAAKCPYVERCTENFGCIKGASGAGCAYCDLAASPPFFSIGSRCLRCGESGAENVATNVSALPNIALLMIEQLSV